MDCEEITRVMAHYHPYVRLGAVVRRDMDMGAVIALGHATEARTDPIQSGAVLLACRSLSRAAGPAASLPARP